jgi:Flp pilus assembly protein TadG
MVVNARKARSGAYVVEFAFVVLIFLLVMFAIIEYARFVFIRQTLDHAAREGARYAVVSTALSTLEADTIAFVKQKMSNVNSMVKNYECQVFEGDSKGAKTGPAADAGFGEYIVVQIDCEYKPFFPVLFLNNTLKLNSRALMFSEAN